MWISLKQILFQWHCFWQTALGRIKVNSKLCFRTNIIPSRVHLLQPPNQPSDRSNHIVSVSWNPANFLLIFFALQQNVMYFCDWSDTRRSVFFSSQILIENTIKCFSRENLCHFINRFEWMVMLQWPGCKVKDMAGIPRNTADFLTSSCACVCVYVCVTRYSLV